MDITQIIVALLGMCMAVLGWFARELYSSVQSLRQDLSDLQVKIGTDYVRYDRLKDIIEPISEALQRIENKLDGKVDK
jgi:hypothetical protein